MSNQQNRKRMAQNRRLRAMGRPKLAKKKVDDFGPAKIDLEPNPAFSLQAKSLQEDIGRMLSSSSAGSAVKKKEGGMVGRATGQGYGAARKGGNLV